MADDCLVAHLTFGEDYTDVTQAAKETLYFVTSAKLRKKQLVCLQYDAQDPLFSVKLERAIKRTLNQMKKRDEIKLYLLSKELVMETTAARYLLEKFPFLATERKRDGQCFYIYI